MITQKTNSRGCHNVPSAWLKVYVMIWLDSLTFYLAIPLKKAKIDAFENEKWDWIFQSCSKFWWVCFILNHKSLDNNLFFAWAAFLRLLHRFSQLLKNIIYLSLHTYFRCWYLQYFPQKTSVLNCTSVYSTKWNYKWNLI